MSGIVYQACELRGEELPAYDQLRSKFTELAEQARAGDAAIAEMISRGARYLGRGLANHINMQDPDRVVVLTQTRELVDLISEPFFEALHRDTLPVLRDLSRVTFKQMDETTYARGAAAMVLEQLYLSR
jgi:predicted NBD/HSP70 family sugar kinase